MKISKRLEALYAAVKHGESVADIGTDHGYVPLMLLRDGISDKVVMSDISRGSLLKAVANFSENGIDVSKESFRIGNGLETLLPGETDDVIIAGLGGNTITEILSADIDKTRSFRKFILQPRNSSGELRFFLYTNGYDITEETLCPEGRFICEVITACRSDINKKKAPYEVDDIRWQYPESFIKCDRNYLKERLSWKFESIEREIRNLKKSNINMYSRIDKLQENKRYLNGLLKKQEDIKK